MKKTLVTLACGLALALTATTAQALTLSAVDTTDPYLLGSVDPGTGSPATEASLINTLLTYAVDPLPDSGYSVNADGRSYNRSANACAACPVATSVGGVGDDVPPIQSTNIDVTNWTYLIGKYGDTLFVWYVADINGFVDLPATAGSGGSGIGSGGGLSHWFLFNPTPTVPDGGATLGLLGLAMLGLGYLRRRKL